MELTQTQIDAVNLLFEDKFTDIDIAIKLEIDVRTLRRWQDLPAFKKEFNDLSTEYAKSTRKKVLAQRERRLSAKMDRHRLLTAKIERRAAQSAIDFENGVVETYEQNRIDLAMYRELSRLEAEIAREVGQDQPAAEETEETPVQDLNCLSTDELRILVAITHKLAKHNPWMIDECYREQTEYDLQRTQNLINKKIAELEESGFDYTAPLATAVDDTEGREV